MTAVGAGSASDAASAPDAASALETAGGAQVEDGPGAPPQALPSPTLTRYPSTGLSFGAFGDVRPANPNDTAGYPDAILSAIFAGLQTQGVSITIDGGDHCFPIQRRARESYCHDQFVNHFMSGHEAHYTGRLFPTMGNHEGCGTYAATAGTARRWSSGLVNDYLLDIVQPTTGQSSSLLLDRPLRTVGYREVRSRRRQTRGPQPRDVQEIVVDETGAPRRAVPAVAAYVPQPSWLPIVGKRRPV